LEGGGSLPGRWPFTLSERIVCFTVLPPPSIRRWR
jgi:hypothetical protein